MIRESNGEQNVYAHAIWQEQWNPNSALRKSPWENSSTRNSHVRDIKQRIESLLANFVLKET